MSRDDDKASDEAFFSRWSRRKRAASEDAGKAPHQAKASLVAPRTGSSSTAQPVAPAGNSEAHPSPPAEQSRPLTEDDFKDVDFTKLDYTSDYSRFTAHGVPESIRQRALTQLWHSDPIFTQVDPFQDYAGDYTDAAAAVRSAGMRTAYRIGQGFLSDEEARTWETLDKGAVTEAIAALPSLRPGYRVRPATIADAAALAALQAAAIRAAAPEAYGADIAEQWATAQTVDVFQERLAEPRTRADIAIHEDSGVIAAFCACEDREIVALHVAPGHGRRGLARRLIERTVAGFETPDATGNITVGASHLSRPIFERLGFRVVADEARMLGNGRTLTLSRMRRPLVTAATLQVAPETPDQTDVRAFFAASEAYLSALYPAESNHFVDVSSLQAAHVEFLVARLNGKAIGCGALVVGEDGSGELKRMWVDPTGRGLQIGARLLASLEVKAQARSLTVVRLETGIHQREAISLYRRAGYREIGPFGAYQPDPLTLFMEKRLGSQ